MGCGRSCPGAEAMPYASSRDAWPCCCRPRQAGRLRSQAPPDDAPQLAPPAHATPSFRFCFACVLCVSVCVVFVCVTWFLSRCLLLLVHSSPSLVSLSLVPASPRCQPLPSHPRPQPPTQSLRAMSPALPFPWSRPCVLPCPLCTPAAATCTAVAGRRPPPRRHPVFGGALRLQLPACTRRRRPAPGRHAAVQGSCPRPPAGRRVSPQQASRRPCAGARRQEPSVCRSGKARSSLWDQPAGMGCCPHVHTSLIEEWVLACPQGRKISQMCQRRQRPAGQQGRHQGSRRAPRSRRGSRGRTYTCTHSSRMVPHVRAP